MGKACRRYRDQYLEDPVTLDLVIADVRLAKGEKRDIGIADGRIVAIEPELAFSARRHEAKGALAFGGFVETISTSTRLGFSIAARSARGRWPRPSR
jgi:dihydroorotase-like cyclic amidohydrolase